MSMSRIERLGYIFHPSSYPHPIGHAAVEVFVAPNEDDWFFATRSATFPIVDETGLGHLHITFPWSLALQEAALAPGRFFLVAHDGDMVEGFSFGGNLSFGQEGDVLNCQLTSAAPFLDLADTSGLAAIIVPEFEAELGRLRAEWTGSDDEFDRRVATTESIDLFIASLRLSDSYVHRLPAMDTDDSTVDERMAVSHAIHGLREAGEWPDNPPTLHQLVLDNRYTSEQAH